MRLQARLLLCAILLLPAPALAQGGIPADSGQATLAPGDVIRIAVWRRPELSGDFAVAPDSTITHPLLRGVKVSGVPLDTVQARLHAFLAHYENDPAFVVSPLLRVFVGGEVRQPSVYTVPPGTTIAQAIAIAGGPTERGQLEKVTLVRHGTRDLLDLTQANSAAATAGVRSSDQLLVARKRNLFTEVIAPSSAVLAATAALANIIIQLRK